MFWQISKFHKSPLPLSLGIHILLKVSKLQTVTLNFASTIHRLQNTRIVWCDCRFQIMSIAIISSYNFPVLMWISHLLSKYEFSMTLISHIGPSQLCSLVMIHIFCSRNPTKLLNTCLFGVQVEKNNHERACLVPSTLLIVSTVCPLNWRFREFYTEYFQKIAHRNWDDSFEGRNLPSTTLWFGCSTVSRALTIVRTYYPKYLASGLLEASTTWSQMLPRLSIIPLWAFWPPRLSAEQQSTTWPWTEILELKKYMQVFSQHQHS